jgi:autotransporter-associated beta strand protein
MAPILLGDVNFHNGATAGSGTFTLKSHASMEFFDGSTAGNGAFTLKAGPHSSHAIFFDNSAAADATFITNGATVSGAQGNFTQFASTTRAGRSTLIANGGLNGGNGGQIFLSESSSGGTARVEVFGDGTGASTNGELDLSTHDAPGVAVGSIEGSGAVILGSNTLTVGGNNLSTIFSGMISGSGGSGSLAKTGKGKLTLSNGSSTYSGGTTVTKGTLLVTNTTGSATGPEAVQVNAGTLAGTGIISGAVMLGTGSGAGAFLSPGKSASLPGSLTINNTLTFNSDSSYKCALKRSTPKATQVVAKGVTINSGAQFVFTERGSGTLSTGTVFTVINNTGATPIAGTFSNLADGSTFTSTGGTTFQANYEGGSDGNDLTLTVQCGAVAIRFPQSPTAEGRFLPVEEDGNKEKKRGLPRWRRKLPIQSRRVRPRARRRCRDPAFYS